MRESEQSNRRRLMAPLVLGALAIVLGSLSSAVADDLSGNASDNNIFSKRPYDQEIAEMRFGFSNPRAQSALSQAERSARARRLNALLPDTGASFRAHYAFSAEAAAEQLEAAQTKANDEISKIERRAKAAITERPVNQRLVRKGSWLNTLGLDRRTVDQRELVAKVSELHEGTRRDVDQVEEMLGDIEADGFLYTLARASHQLVISAEKSAAKIYNDYVAPKDAYADEGEGDNSYKVNGSRPLLSYERDGISRF